MFNKINDDLKDAMKSGDKFKLSVLRMLKSALQLEAINRKKDLEDDEVASVIKKQIKQRNDSIVEYEKYNEVDRVETLKKEVEILNAYLPEEVSDEVLNSIINEVFNDIKPTSMKEMGLVIKSVSERLKGMNADMGKVSAIVKERLN